MLNGFKTYLGIVVAALGGLATSLGVDPGGVDLPTWLTQLVSLAGLAFAWYGRWDKERRDPGGN